MAGFMAQSAARRRPGHVAMLMPWFDTLLNLHQPRHVRMQRAEVFVVAGRRKSEGEAAVGVQRLGPVLACRDHRMRNVVMVGPGHGVANLDRHFGRSEGEVVDGDLDGLCAERRGVEHKHEQGGREGGADAPAQRYELCHCVGPQPCSGVSMIASRSAPTLKSMLAMPSRLRSLVSSTFIGPGE